MKTALLHAYSCVVRMRLLNNTLKSTSSYNNPPIPHNYNKVSNFNVEKELSKLAFPISFVVCLYYIITNLKIKGPLWNRRFDSTDYFH